MSARPKIKIEHVKKGRRKVGAIYHLPSGKCCFLANRRIEDALRGDERDISAAIRSGKAAWGLDDETLLRLRVQGIRFVGVLVRETGDKFLTIIDRFFDPENAKLSRQGWALQRYVPFSQFRSRAGRVKI